MEESINFRWATIYDFLFMYNGVWDVYLAEEYDLNMFSKEAEEQKIKRAINDQRVFIAEQDDG
jgi:hypothetical protein